MALGGYARRLAYMLSGVGFVGKAEFRTLTDKTYRGSVI